MASLKITLFMIFYELRVLFIKYKLQFLMLILFKKKISVSEKKWGFIQLPVKLTTQLPKEFHVTFDDRTFQLKINSKNRIVSKKIYDGLGLLDGDTVVLEQNEKTYSISLIRG